MEALAIAPDTVVTLSYVLFDERGEVVDGAGKPAGDAGDAGDAGGSGGAGNAGEHDGDSEPLTYVHGYAQIVPGLERQIEGLKAGERGVFTVEAEEAFGARDDDAIFAVDKSDFPDAADVAVGDEFMAEGPDGEPIAMRVLEVQEDSFVVDTNHPLAGQRVRFEVLVGSVRAAAEDEIAAAQAELEALAAEDDDACGCGHDHGHEDGHDHDHDHAHHDHDHSEVSLIQLGKKS